MGSELPLHPLTSELFRLTTTLTTNQDNE